MNDNVVSIRKSDQYGLYRAKVEGGEVVETDQLGVAYLKSGATLFRLRLWMFPKEQYFLAIDEGDLTKYIILSLDEYQAQSGEARRRWSKVGDGAVQGNFIRLKFWLLAEDIYLSLFPAAISQEVRDVA